MVREDIPLLAERDLACTESLRRSSRHSILLLARFIPLAGLTLLCAAFCFEARAVQNVSLAWDPSPDTNVIGYAVYYGTASGSYGSRLDVGTNLTGTVSGLLEWQPYYFVAVAYNAQAVESPPSNEVSFRPVAGIRQVSGRVIWGGQPLAGARVWTTQGSAIAETWTASDGTYTLHDLGSTNAYTVSCSSTGLTFTPQFQNPVSLAAGNGYGIDFYANEPLPPVSGNTYSVSGQVTDPINAVAGVEVRAGGLTATTDASGNYQFTNFVNGSYLETAQKDSWTFSPASRTVTVSSANSSGNNFSRSAPYSISGQFSGLPVGAQSPAPTVYLSNGRSVQATKAGSGANKYWAYTLSNVPAGQYSLSAELSGYSIVPAGFNNPLNISGNLSSINFTGTAASVAGPISGRVTQQGLPLAGANVAINQGSSTIGSASSDSDGYYRVENMANGSYSVIPTRAGYVFSPGSVSVSSLPASGINFTASGPAAPTVTSLTASPLVVPSATGTTTLAVAATGSGPLTFSWSALSAPAPLSFSANDSIGAASTSVTFVAPGSYTFRARVTATNGLSASSNITVTVNASPGAMVITPYQAQAAGGQTVSFEAAAWDQLGNRISASPSWSVSGGGSIDSNGVFLATAPGGPFTITAVSGALSATSLVTVTSAATNLPPAIGTQPQSVTNVAGTTAMFGVIANGSAPLTYQWRLNGAEVPGATTTSLNLTNVQANDAGNYTVVVTNNVGAVTSAVASLTVLVPPSITTPPLSQTNIAGTTATFTVSATGTVPLICQWRFNGATIVGATSSALTLSNVQPNNAGNYNVVITNNAGATTSTVATLTVLVPPSITSQPQSQTNVAGATASFSVGATGTAPLICQWQLNGGTIAGATGTTLTLNNVQPSDAGNYNVVVANSAGATTSAVATLTVLVPPSITTQPQSATNIAGTAAAFSVAANGSVPLSYQWKFNGTDIPGATGATLTLNDVQANDAGNYAVVVTNNVGSVTSIVAALTVLVPPSITTPPLSQTNIAGTNVTFSVTATGTAPLICQWRFNGATIAGATGTSLTLSNLQANDAGNYYVVVTNTVGAATSVVATLTVLVPPSIAGQPQSRTAAVGANATFTVIADGSAPLSYQWLFNGTAVFGATVSSFTRTNLLPADAGNYSVQVTNAAGMAISSNAALSIIEPPAISAQPLSQAVAAGSNVTFTILATGTPPLIYQWQLNGSDIAGATTNAYTRPNAQSADAGSYTVAVTNGAGTVTSDEAILTVNTPPTLAAVSNQTIHAGSTLTVSNSATDIDVPSQTLAFGLDPGAPAGAAIDTNSGVLVWVTRLADAGATNVITVRVTDNGTPSLSDAKSFVITVVAPLTVRSINASNSNITISWEAIPGQAYRVDFKDRLDIIQWSSLAGDVVATSSTASKTDPIGPGQRYYRVRLVE